LTFYIKMQIQNNLVSHSSIKSSFLLSKLINTTLALSNLTALMNYRKFYWTVCLFIFSLTFSLSQSVYAQTTKTLPLRDSVEDITIESEKQNTDETGNIFTAIGDVKITYPNRNIFATAEQAEYLRDEGIIILTGNVNLVKEGSVYLQGDRFVYFLKDDQFVADSNNDSQVHLDILLDPEISDDKSSLL